MCGVLCHVLYNNVTMNGGHTLPVNHNFFICTMLHDCKNISFLSVHLLFFNCAGYTLFVLKLQSWVSEKLILLMWSNSLSFLEPCWYKPTPGSCQWRWINTVILTLYLFKHRLKYFVSNQQITAAVLKHNSLFKQYALVDFRAWIALSQ
jgi:hypothetical protein